MTQAATDAPADSFRSVASSRIPYPETRNCVPDPAAILSPPARRQARLRQLAAPVPAGQWRAPETRPPAAAGSGATHWRSDRTFGHSHQLTLAVNTAIRRP